MRHLVKSELRKVFYTRSYWGLILGAVALAALSSAASPYAMSKIGDTKTLFSNANLIDSLYGKSVAGYLFVVILGVIVMAGEFKNGTAVATYLTAPKRASVLYAKLITASITGTIMMIIATIGGIVAAWIALGFYPEAVAPHLGVFLNLTAVALVSGAVLSIFGVAIGALIRNQMIATVAVIVWMNIVERLLIVFFPEAGKWLPTGALTGMMALDLNFSSEKIGIALNTKDYLDPWTSTAVLVGYGVAFSVVAVFTSLKRDVD